MKNILIPTDLSDNSWDALVYVLKMYMEDECMFYLLNAANKEKNRASEKMEELIQFKTCAEDADANANHSFQILLSSESLVDAISIAVKKYEIDLLVFVNSGHSESFKKDSESSTEQVLKMMKLCPVLVIPANSEYLEVNQMAIMTDLNRFHLEKDLLPIKNLAGDCKIRILYFSTNKSLNAFEKYNMQQLENLLSDCDCCFHRLESTDDIVSEVNFFVENFRIGMISILNSTSQLMNGEVKNEFIYEMGYSSKVPLLVIQD